MNQIQKITGFFFLLITTSALSKEAAGGLQKDQSTLNNLNHQKPVEVYARSTSYIRGDKHTNRGESSTGIGLRTVNSMGLHAVSANPNLYPYGSVVIHQSPNKKRSVGVVVDVGGDVVSAKAAKELALKKGYGTQSREYNAPVLDFYAPQDITAEWDTFTVIKYDGPSFAGLSEDRKIAYLRKVTELYGTTVQ